MFLRRFLPTNRKAEGDRSSLQVDDRPPDFTFNAPTHTLPGRDSVREPDESESSPRLTETLGLAETSKVTTPSPIYIYYRIYAEDGPIPSKTPVAPSDPFLGRIKIRFVPPPRNAKAVKCSISKVENIKDSISTSLFLSSYSKSPMSDSDKITSILNGTGPGSTPEEPLALVAKMSDSERITLESDGRGGLASASTAEPDTTHPEIRYVYYLLYADGYAMPSKVAFDPEESSLGRIRGDYIAPPHSPTSIKRCISRVERNPAFAHADLFADTSCETPLKESHISILRTDGPGLNPNEPMAIVQVKKSPDSPPILDGKYVIKNRASNIYWCASAEKIQFLYCDMEYVKKRDFMQWGVTQDTYGNISMKSLFDVASYSGQWVGDELIRSTVAVSWRLIPADRKFYYLTTDIFGFYQNPRVPEAQRKTGLDPGSMAALMEGDQWQMWEFIRI